MLFRDHVREESDGGADASVPFWMIHVLVREDIVPAFSRLRSPMHLDSAIADDLPDQIITNVVGVQRVLGLVRPHHTSYS
ncbi:MAG TPA: hypothetical protein EYN74_07540 [Nitrospirales bacterium]|nr:hypothetical protein [Nitrospirales bacterium]